MNGDLRGPQGQDLLGPILMPTLALQARLWAHTKAPETLAQRMRRQGGPGCCLLLPVAAARGSSWVL